MKININGLDLEEFDDERPSPIEKIKKKPKSKEQSPKNKIDTDIYNKKDDKNVLL